MRFVSSIHIDQPPDIVNQAYTDPDNMPYWTKHLEKFEVVKGNITQAGALARLHFKKRTGHTSWKMNCWKLSQVKDINPA